MRAVEIAPRFPHSHRPGACCYDFVKSNPKGTNPSTRSSFFLQAHPSIGKDSRASSKLRLWIRKLESCRNGDCNTAKKPRSFIGNWRREE